MKAYLLFVCVAVHVGVCSTCDVSRCKCGPDQNLQAVKGTGNILKQLTRLEALDVQYHTFRLVPADVGLWRNLPTLKGLSIIDADGSASSWPSLKDMLQSRLPNLHGLTRLELTVFGAGSSDGMQVCANLVGLTKLQRLQLAFVGAGRVAGRDCLHLIGMRALTSLVLDTMRGGVDDMVAVALACNLQELRHLDLNRCFIESDAAMPAFAQMRHLTKVVLTGNRACSKENLVVLQKHRRAAGLPHLIVLK